MSAGKYATLIAIFKEKFKNGEPLSVVSPGTQKRNFTHVEDIVDGLVRVGERGVGDDFGLGAEEGYSILEIAQMFGGEIAMLPERAGNRMTSSIDTARSRDLGWEPKRKVKEYISEFVRSQKS